MFIQASLAFLATLGILAAIRQHMEGIDYTNACSFTALPLAGMILTFVWFSAFKVEVKDGILKYSTLFSRTRSVRLENVRSAEFNVDFSAPLGPPFRIEVRYLNGDSIGRLIINAKVFALKDLHRLLAILNTGKNCAGISHCHE